MKISELKKTLEDFFLLEDKEIETNEKEISQLLSKLDEKRKNIKRKIKKCDGCEEKKELNKKLKAVEKLIKKAKKNF